MLKSLSAMPLWVRAGLPVAVAAAALTIGSGVFDRASPTTAQRAASIESLVRCPSCTGVSVAQSNESTALAVRHQIERQVAAGRTQSQIEQTLVSQYGPTILLEPSGGFSPIWVVPIVLGAMAVVSVAALFWRRTSQFAALRARDPS